jgi:hypothetical protein
VSFRATMLTQLASLQSLQSKGGKAGPLLLSCAGTQARQAIVSHSGWSAGLQPAYRF